VIVRDHTIVVQPFRLPLQAESLHHKVRIAPENEERTPTGDARPRQVNLPTFAFQFAVFGRLDFGHGPAPSAAGPHHS
jgi:hypothetical protein